MKLQIILPFLIFCLVLGWGLVIGCSSEPTDDSIRPEQPMNPPRVIAFSPKLGAQRSAHAELNTVAQEFRISFSQPIIPNSGRIVFGETPFQLKETEATDTITWNQCFRTFAYVAPDDNISSIVIRDFQNVNGDVQAHPYVGWFRIAPFYPAPPIALEYHPKGQDVDPKTTRGVRVVFDRPMQDRRGETSFEISPPIKVAALRIDNEDMRACTGIVTWEFGYMQELNYATKYSVSIAITDDMGQPGVVDFSFTTRAAP